MNLDRYRYLTSRERQAMEWAGCLIPVLFVLGVVLMIQGVTGAFW